MISNRLETIKQMRRDDFTLKQVGLRFGITAERVRQILLQKEVKRCSVHNVFISDQCLWCEHDHRYQLLLSKLKKENLWQKGL